MNNADAWLARIWTTMHKPDALPYQGCTFEIVLTRGKFRATLVSDDCSRSGCRNCGYAEGPSIDACLGQLYDNMHAKQQIAKRGWDTPDGWNTEIGQHEEHRRHFVAHSL